MSLGFSRIYLDTEPLIAGGWPQVGGEVKELAGLAQILDIPVLIARPVELELVAHYRRELEEVQAKGAGTARTLARLCGTVGVVHDVPKPADVPLLIERHAQQAEAAISKHKLIRIPLTSRALEEIVKRCLDRRPPFTKDGRGLGDTLIYLSVVDHLAAAPAPAVLVTRDSDYPAHTDECPLLTRASSTVVIEELTKRLGGAVAQQVSEFNAAALAAAKIVLPELNHYAAEQLALDPFDASLFPLKLHRFDSVTVVSVERVFVAAMPWDVRPGDKVELLINATARVGITVEAPTIDDKSLSLTVGETMADHKARLVRAALLSALEGNSSDSRLRTTDFDRIVTFKATGEWTGGGFADVRPKSVALGLVLA